MVSHLGNRSLLTCYLRDGRHKMVDLFVCTSKYIHFCSMPIRKLIVLATVHGLMNYTNSIDSCQAHLLVQYASNIELIRQK